MTDEQRKQQMRERFPEMAACVDWLRAKGYEPKVLYVENDAGDSVGRKPE